MGEHLGVEKERLPDQPHLWAEPCRVLLKPLPQKPDRHVGVPVQKRSVRSQPARHMTGNRMKHIIDSCHGQGATVRRRSKGKAHRSEPTSAWRSA